MFFCDFSSFFLKFFNFLMFFLNRKYFIQRNNENKVLEEQLYKNIDSKIKSFIVIFINFIAFLT